MSVFLLFRVRLRSLLGFGLKHAWQVELYILVDKEGYAGRWHDPDEVWPESVIVRILVKGQF